MTTPANDAPATTIDNLRDDLERMRGQVPADAPPYIANLIAFMEPLLDTIEDMDESILDILEGHEDILQPRTAAAFAFVIVGCKGVVAELAKRLNRKDKKDIEIAKGLNDLVARCNHATEILATITAQRDDEEEEFDPDAEANPSETTQPETETEEVADADAAK